MACSSLSKGSCIKLIGSFEFNDSFKRFIIVDKRTIREISEAENTELQTFLDNIYVNKCCFDKIYNVGRFELKFNGLVNIRDVDNENWNIVIVTTQENIDQCQKTEDFDLVLESIFLHGSENTRKSDFNSGLARRSISTYGYIEHPPIIGYFDYYLEKYIDGEEYIVSDILNGAIPNQKPRSNGNSDSKYLSLEPKNGLENNERIFWYIDERSMTINQYEDGYVLQNLKQIIEV